METFKVPDMTCGHCEKSIRKELESQGPEVKVEVDLKSKLVKVENLSRERVLSLLKDVGYTPELVK